ncbi:acetyltransferase [Aquirufa antheringensis]|nr:acetyltransferase [Aquirufa antheringensis]
MGVMKKVIIMGSGAHAAEIEQYIIENNSFLNEFELLGFISDSEELYNKYKLRAPYLGDTLNEKYINENVEIILGFSNVKGRFKLINQLTKRGFKFAKFVHHTSSIFPTATIDEGCIICPYCQIGPNVVIHKFNTLNNKVNIGHDTTIGTNNIFCPNVGLSGNTKIGDNNFFSINSATIPNIQVGNSNIIAPNMVIEKNLKSDTTFFHRFKETVLFTTNEI